MALIGAHLARSGHQVVLLTDEAHRDVAMQHGLTFEPLDPAACVGVPPPASAFNRLLPNLMRRYLLGRTDIASTFIAPLVPQYHSLRRVLDRHGADAVLVDLAFTGAMPLLHSDPRPAVVVCGVGPLTLTSADSAPFGMAWTPRPGRDHSTMHRAVDRILFRDMAYWLDDALAAVGAPPCPVALMDWPRLADRLLQLSVPGFEYPRGDLPPNVAFVGPVLPRPVRDFDPPPWWGEMRRARTVVHVTQGTLDNGNLDQLIGPTVEAFADDDGVVVVATVGRRAGQQLTFAIPSNAHVCEWLPYSALLPHVDVMVTNGGYGGVNHALSYGIPVVVAGESSDKAEVAARVAHTGVGINLRTAHPRARQIAAAVRSIDDTHRQAAGRLGQQIAQTTPLDAIADVVAAELAATAHP
jgi:hypothetical protein